MTARSIGRWTVPCAAVLAVTMLSGCQSQAQKEVDQQAEAIDESYEAQADLTEAVAAGGPNEAVAENRADALREKGDKVKDHLEDMADELDDVPKK